MSYVSVIEARQTQPIIGQYIKNILTPIVSKYIGYVHNDTSRYLIVADLQSAMNSLVCSRLLSDFRIVCDDTNNVDRLKSNIDILFREHRSSISYYYMNVILI